MRICIIGSRGYPSHYGGFETYVRMIAPWLVEQGHSVVVYGRPSGRAALLPVSIEIDGVVSTTTPGWDRMTLSALSFGLTGTAFAAWDRPDVALVLNPANGYFLPLLRAARVPCAVNVDGIEWEREKWNRLGRTAHLWGARSVARWADTVVVDSRAIGERWWDQFGRSSAFVPYGAPISLDRPTTRLSQIPLQPGSYALVVARLVPENNVSLLMDAADNLAPALPFVFVGSAGYDSPIEARLEALARSNPNVHWLGHVSDDDLLSDLWYHARIYLHGHSVGGTNPALLQAMGAGCAILAHDNVFAREVLGDAGTYFSDGDSLLAGIQMLDRDDAKRLSFGQHARARAASAYSWQQSRLRTLEALQKTAALQPRSLKR